MRKDRIVNKIGALVLIAMLSLIFNYGVSE